MKVDVLVLTEDSQSRSIASAWLVEAVSAAGLGTLEAALKLTPKRASQDFSSPAITLPTAACAYPSTTSGQDEAPTGRNCDLTGAVTDPTVGGPPRPLAAAT